MPFTSVTTFKEIADSFREIQLSGNRGIVKPTKISITLVDPGYINNGGEGMIRVYRTIARMQSIIILILPNLIE